MKWKLKSDDDYDYYYRFYDFHDEDSFNRKLYLERKRTERSNKPFLLMLLNLETLLQEDKNGQLLRKIVAMLFSITRDIDLKGWYQYNSTIGILYAEMDPFNDVTKKHDPRQD